MISSGWKDSILDDFVQGLPLKEFHGDIDGSLVLSDIINHHHVGMGESSDGLGLFHESLQKRFRGNSVRPQHLQGHQSIDLRVMGLVDHPHRTFSQFLQNAVASVIHESDYLPRNSIKVDTGIKKPTESVPRYLPLMTPTRFPWASNTGLPLLPGSTLRPTCQSGMALASLGGLLTVPT